MTPSKHIPGSDAGTPNFFTVNAAGEITAEFEGVINALGLKIPAALLAEEEAGVFDKNRVKFFDPADPAKKRVAQLTAVIDRTVIHRALALLQADPEDQTGINLVVNILQSKGKEKEGSLQVVVNNATGEVSVGVSVWEAGGVILDNTSKSSFLQLSGIRKERDFGIVTALPGAPVVGDRCHYVASAANGTYWQFIYDGVGLFPWKFVGGSPLFQEAAGNVNTESAAFVELAGGPELKNPLGGDYIISFGASLLNTEASKQARLAFFFNKETDIKEVVHAESAGGGFQLEAGSLEFQARLETPQTHNIQYNAIIGGKAQFSNRFLSLTPIRCK